MIYLMIIIIPQIIFDMFYYIYSSNKSFHNKNTWNIIHIIDYEIYDFCCHIKNHYNPITGTFINNGVRKKNIFF